MAEYLSVATQWNGLLEDLEIKITNLKNFVGKGFHRVYAPEVRELANKICDDISNSAMTLRDKIRDERGDSLPQLMKVIEGAFIPENRPKIYNSRMLRYLAKQVLEARDNIDITPNEVCTIVKRLGQAGINVDYLRAPY